ncbi:MAG: flavin reductase [Anaerolineae bacterium]|nr:flavin reductase [Anaerolineae bacterium]
MSFDPTRFRHTMRLWATGVTVVSAQHGPLRRGTTVSSFTSVTLEPPLVLVCLQKSTETADVIHNSGAFAVSMLGEGQEAISNRFAGYGDLPPEVDRFSDMDVMTAETGAPILAAAMGWVDCRLHARQDASTHWIFMGQVVAASGQPEHAPYPLIYYNREYRQIAR